MKVVSKLRNSYKGIQEEWLCGRILCSGNNNIRTKYKVSKHSENIENIQNREFMCAKEWKLQCKNIPKRKKTMRKQTSECVVKNESIQWINWPNEGEVNMIIKHGTHTQEWWNSHKKGQVNTVSKPRGRKQRSQLC